ncbi:MAG: iron-sulfur cluster assembly scaffold protein [Lysobacterales bacterium]
MVNSRRSAPADHLADLYRDSIRRHAAEPTGFDRPIMATHRHEAYNPLCGDRVGIGLRVAGDVIEEAAFTGEACAICMASASMLCGLAPGRTVAALRQLSDDLHEALAAPVGDDPRGIPEDLHALLGVRPYPSRIRCAALPWTAAVTALKP